MTDDKFLKIAKQAAIEAGEIVNKYYQSELHLQNKGHFANFATKADLEAEKAIIQIISKNFPGHNIIAEESGMVNKNSKYTWAIDPIDGTIPFVDGIPHFGVSIGLLENNEPILGVINMVASKELFWAQTGKGAFVNGDKIRVRKESNLYNSTIGVGLGHTNRMLKLSKHLKPFAEKVRFIYLFGSAVSMLSLLAKGNIDGYILRANIWDVAAGAVLVAEAGGKVTDTAGNSIDWNSPKIQLLASNGLIHDQMLKALKGEKSDL